MKKLRLFRFMWERGVVGDGDGYSAKLAVALRPKLFRFEREWDGWRINLIGIEVSKRVSWGGRFV